MVCIYFVHKNPYKCVPLLLRGNHLPLSILLKKRFYITLLPVKYDKKLGLTEAEFSEYRHIIDNYRMSSELTFDMVIKMKDSILEFESEYNKELFNELKIDLSKEKVLLGSHEFKLTDTIDFPNDNNRVGSVWKAYQWTFQIPDKIDMSNVVQLAQTDVVLYRIAFGILQPSKTLYLSIKGVEVEKGVHIVNFVQPFFLKPKKE